MGAYFHFLLVVFEFGLKSLLRLIVLRCEMSCSELFKNNFFLRIVVTDAGWVGLVRKDLNSSFS
jgi:hypothetical protein